MAIPVISQTSSYLGFRRNEAFQFVPFASNTPLWWDITPVPGLSVDTPAIFAATGVASTDILTATGNDFANGDRVFFRSISGGSGLSANTVYWVRDLSGATFALAATPTGAAVNFSSDISAAQIQKVSSGTISSAGISVQGPIVFQVTATNGDGAASQEFVIGIGPGSSLAASAADTAIDVAVDLATGISKLGREMQASPTAELQPDAAPLAYLKSGNVRIFAFRFFKDGTQVDPAITAMQLYFKEFAPEKVLIKAESFEKVGTGANAVYRLAVSIERRKVKATQSNYEADRDTFFDARVELGWRSTITHDGSPLELVGTTQTFPIRLSADFTPNAD